MNNFRQLDEVGSNYFRDGLLQEEIEERGYEKQRIPIGRERNGRIFYIDLSDALRMFILGKTGSGKTFFLRGISDRLFKAGYEVVFLPDVKAEMKSSKDPVQKKFHDQLLPNEIPQGFPITTYRPTFFKQLNVQKATDDIWWSPRLTAMSKADFLTLLNAESLSIPQQVILEIVYEEMRTRLQNDEEISFEDFDEIIDGIEDITTAQKTSMKFKFRPLKTSSFVDSEHQVEILEDLEQHRMVALNMDYFDSFGRGGFGYAEVSVSIMLREVVNFCKSATCHKAFIMTDEASRFIPADRNPSCKRDFMEAVDLFRRYGVSNVFATQELTKIPPEIVRQCRYVCIPYSATVGELKDVMVMAGAVRNVQNAMNQAISLKGRLRRFDWVIFDTLVGSNVIIRPLSPLSKHMES